KNGLVGRVGTWCNVCRRPIEVENLVLNTARAALEWVRRLIDWPRLTHRTGCVLHLFLEPPVLGAAIAVFADGTILDPAFGAAHRYGLGRANEFFPRFFERPDGAGIAIIRTVWIAMPVITFRPRAFLFHLVVIVTEIIQVLLCLLTVLLGPVTYLVHFPSAAGIVSNTLAASRGGHILQYARLFLIQRFTDFGRQDVALTKLLNHLFDCFAVGLGPEPFERRFDILHRNLSPTDRPNLYRRRSS